MFAEDYIKSVILKKTIIVMWTLFQHPNIISTTMFALCVVAKYIHIVQSDFTDILNKESYSMLYEYYFNILI